jgi:hypothetical protein
MCGKVARRIRKMVYGDEMAFHSSGRYSISEHVRTFLKKIGGKTKEVRVETGTLICTGLRARYKETKKRYLAFRRKGNAPEVFFAK